MHPSLRPYASQVRAFFLCAPRMPLCERIDARCSQMLEGGLLEEVATTPHRRIAAAHCPRSCTLSSQLHTVLAAAHPSHGHTPASRPHALRMLHTASACRAPRQVTQQLLQLRLQP